MTADGIVQCILISWHTLTAARLFIYQKKLTVFIPMKLDQNQNSFWVTDLMHLC
jgi:hypothetical protein